MYLDVIADRFDSVTVKFPIFHCCLHVFHLISIQLQLLAYILQFLLCSHGITQNGASYQGRRCERHHCSILPGSDGTYPCTKAALFWEASQSLAQFASAQRCQAGPLLHEQVGKEEVCDGQLAYEQIQHLI